MKFIIGNKLNINAILYRLNLNKIKNDPITDIKITIGIEKVDRKNTHAYMFSVEPGESNVIGETIATTRLNGNAKQNIIFMIIVTILIILFCCRFNNTTPPRIKICWQYHLNMYFINSSKHSTPINFKLLD